MEPILSPEQKLQAEIAAALMRIEEMLARLLAKQNEPETPMRGLGH